MSDFLGNLAMKSLGVAPLVQPRPLSPFEALPAGGAFAGRLAAERAAEPGGLETESTVQPRPAAPTTVQPAPFTSEPFDGARHSRTPAFEGARHASRVPPAEAQPASARTVQPGRFTPEPFEGARYASTPAFEGARHAVPPPEAPPAPTQAAHPMGWAQPVALPPPPLPKREVAVNESQAEHPHVRRALTPVVEQIKASPGSSQTVAAQAESPAARAEPTPTISITIGRVEVRAAPPPAASARRAAAGAKPTAAPSLDDYLRMRSGGKP